jgi:hypothetical protein
MIRTSSARPLIVRTLVEGTLPPASPSRGCHAVARGRAGPPGVSFWPVEARRIRGPGRAGRDSHRRPGLSGPPL